MPNDLKKLELSVTDALSGLHNLRSDVEHFKSQCDQLTHARELDQVELESLRGQVSMLKAERDFYLRFCAELTANLSNISMIVGDCMQKAKDNAYRPTNGANAERINQVAANLKISEFLNGGPTNEHD